MPDWGTPPTEIIPRAPSTAGDVWFYGLTVNHCLLCAEKNAILAYRYLMLSPDSTLNIPDEEKLSRELCCIVHESSAERGP